MLDTQKAHDQIIAAGIGDPGTIKPDSRLHRFPRKKSSSWYICHQNLQYNFLVLIFGSWVWGKGNHRVWNSKDTEDLSPDELSEMRRTIKKACEKAEAERKALAAKAQSKAMYVLKASQPASSDYLYLQHKQIPVCNLRIYKGSLVIPGHDINGILWTVQFIDAEGNKRFLKDGAKSGHFYTISQLSSTILICEGVATGHTLHQQTRHAVVVAFDAGNLKSVAQAIRAKYPDARIIICADNDRKRELETGKNPGITKAMEAAIVIGAELSIPKFPNNSPIELSDWNDLTNWKAANEGGNA